MIKLSEEDVLKAETRLKARPLVPVKLYMQMKSCDGDWKCYSSEHMSDKKAKQLCCYADVLVTG